MKRIMAGCMVFALTTICPPTVASDIAEAGMYGELEVLQRAIDHGESLEVRDEDGSTALNNAVTYGHLESARLLLEHGAQVNTKDSGGDTPLHNLALFRHRKDLQIGELLLAKGADTNARDADGYTPFRLAITLGRTALVRMLLGHAEGELPADADRTSLLDSKDDDGSTALDDAVGFGRLEIVKLLLEHHAKVDVRDNEGSTPLQTLTVLEFPQDVRIAKLLLANGADINVRDNDGDTPLHDAVAYGRVDLIRLFLSHGGDINARNNKGMTPIFWVCDIEDLATARKTIDLLLAKGAEINARDNEDDTLGVYTNCFENSELMALLKAKGLESE